MLNIWYANDLPYGPRLIWAPGPWAPGPSLLGEHLTKNAPWKKEPKLCFLVFFGNKKDALRP